MADWPPRFIPGNPPESSAPTEKKAAGEKEREHLSRPGKIYKAPQVDQILQAKALENWRAKLLPDALTRFIRHLIQTRRQNLAGSATNDLFEEDLTASLAIDPNGMISESAEHFAEFAALKLDALYATGLRKVVNGTGIIINTNLGRAPLPEEIGQYLADLLPHYSNLEFDLETGKRGERNTKIELLFKLIAGSEKALIVNNCAAAVMLTIASLAKNKEVLVSRGELVEIGGSFRLPDVIEAAGGRLKEVGTTNRTRLSDYAAAIGPETGLILKCHQSNFEMRGFVEETSVAELAVLSGKSALPLIEDLGSGALYDLAKLGFKAERLVSQSVKDGADLTIFSGDKLLGGPQAGIILGKEIFLSKIRGNPIYRAVRADKFLVAFLEVVLTKYLFKSPQELLPILTMAQEAKDSISLRVDHFIERMAGSPAPIKLTKLATKSAFGGGTSPGQTQDSFAILLKSELPPEAIARHLRRTTPPVVVLTQYDGVIIDFRTIPPHEEEMLYCALLELQEKLTN